MGEIDNTILYSENTTKLVRKNPHNWRFGFYLLSFTAVFVAFIGIAGRSPCFLLILVLIIPLVFVEYIHAFSFQKLTVYGDRLVPPRKPRRIMLTRRRRKQFIIPYDEIESVRIDLNIPMPPNLASCLTIILRDSAPTKEICGRSSLVYAREEIAEPQTLADVFRDCLVVLEIKDYAKDVTETSREFRRTVLRTPEEERVLHGSSGTPESHDEEPIINPRYDKNIKSMKVNVLLIALIGIVVALTMHMSSAGIFGPLIAFVAITATGMFMLMLITDFFITQRIIVSDSKFILQYGRRSREFLYGDITAMLNFPFLAFEHKGKRIALRGLSPEICERITMEYDRYREREEMDGFKRV